MANKKWDAFVSYNRHDQAFVRHLFKRLTAAGLTVFFDQTELAVGDSLATVLAEAVGNARFVVIVMSPEYFESAWASRELELAFSQELDQGTVKVIPVMRRDCTPPPFLTSKVWADFRHDSDFENSIKKLIAALKREPAALTALARQNNELAPGQLQRPISETMRKEIADQVKEAVRSFLSDESTEPSSVRNSVEPEVDPRLCFVVMPFGSEELNIVYEDFVRPTLENDCELNCQRGDDLFGSGAIMDDIRRSIERACLVVADLTGKNANVFYEVGIAHTLDKQVLLLAQSMSDVPFDLRHRRVLLYDYSPRGCKKLEQHLAENVKAMLKRSKKTSA